MLGLKEIVEMPKEKRGQFIVYKDKKPTYFVDCFDFNLEVNQVFNGLLMARRKTISEILSKVNKEQNVRLTLESAPLIKIIDTVETKDLKLQPFPLEWLN